MINHVWFLGSPGSDVEIRDWMNQVSDVRQAIYIHLPSHNGSGHGIIITVFLMFFFTKQSSNVFVIFSHDSPEPSNLIKFGHQIYISLTSNWKPSQGHSFEVTSRETSTISTIKGTSGEIGFFQFGIASFWAPLLPLRCAVAARRAWSSCNFLKAGTQGTCAWVWYYVFILILEIC